MEVSVPQESEPPSRLRIDWVDASQTLVVQFPVSITESGDRIAKIVSKNSYDYHHLLFPLWVKIKSVKTDESESMIEVISPDLASKLFDDCLNGPSTCIHMDELKERVAAANAVLEKDRWRPFPCIRTESEKERDEPGCEPLFEMSLKFKGARLLVSRRKRQLINARKPTWAYRDPSRECLSQERTKLQSVAFDPETGLLVIGLQFSSMIEGCDVPFWDFHPIRLPVPRKEPPRDCDGGTP